MKHGDAMKYIMAHRRWRLAMIWGRVVFVVLEILVAGYLINDWRIFLGVFLMLWAHNVSDHSEEIK